MTTRTGAAGALGPGEAHVWYGATDSLTHERVRRLSATLSPDERIKADRFRFPADRRDYIAAHALLRASLSNGYPMAPRDWEFIIDARGKPRIANPPDGVRAFSLSHTRGFVAISIATMPAIGVDVECIDRRIGVSEMAQSCCSDAEANRVAAATSAAAHFFELWTLKEAYVKAVGTGLSQQLRDISFDIFEGVIDPSVRAIEPAWRFAVYAPTARVRLAVAANAGSENCSRLVLHGDDAPLIASTRNWKR